jgi:glycyl-tRNA synthetase
MTQKHTFQSIILQLQDFWAAKGCLIGQPYYTQVGAGTMNPATFLRVLGPEPWNVAYVEPSVRPDDGRYGENPNRFQLHHQFQVILKPDPGNPVELYLESLAAVGIDPRLHDIRLVEDNWEQPAISAWGLGWEIWLDGQEITQFTYFQQVGGQSLDPVAVEITYGLERILIALNNAPAIWDEPWNERVSYGDIRRQEEFEHSKYYFEIGDVERLRQMYELYRAEAQGCLAAGLVLPAHDYVLKCSHTFNALDCRGAVGVTERQVFYGQMREMARKVAEGWLQQRKEKEYPLLHQAAGTAQEQTGSRQSAEAHGETPTYSLRPASFLLEIGAEELPAADLDSALEQLRASVPSWLAGLRLEHGEVSVSGTPRRLAVQVEALAPRQADRDELVKGPPAGRAFDPNGMPTQAAIGFAKGRGVKVSALEVRELEGGRYICAVVKQAGLPAHGVLEAALPGLLETIHFDKSMRWNASNVAFSRPIRWLVALLGEAVLHFEYAEVPSGRSSRGLRPAGSPEIAIRSAARYSGLMTRNGICLQVNERQAAIAAGVQQLAASVGGEAIMPPELLQEVANLVEKPTLILGQFDREYLALPEDVLVSVMKKHQRYFPIRKAGVGPREPLLSSFVIVCNGGETGLDLVRQGNEHVVRARFSDADFFVREDVRQPLEAFRPRLATLVFQKKLGSMLDKNERLEKLVRELTLGNNPLRLNAAEADFACRAAHLAKADLVTRMVVEMTSLQGVMGREYALRSGENQTVADALSEQYLTVPKTKPGLAVALADRLDSLTGLFAAGLVPSGTKDPFGLRRAAIGVVQPLVEHDLDFDLAEAVRVAASFQPIEAGSEIQAQVLEFLAGRLRTLLLERGGRYDVVEAVLASQAGNPARAARAVVELATWVKRADWNRILPAYARCVRITRDQTRVFNLLPELLVEPAEKDLWAGLEQAEKRSRRAGSVDDFLQAFLPLIPEVSTFFDRVLVMAENVQLQHNRLGLLQRIVGLARGAADLSKLEGF